MIVGAGVVGCFLGRELGNTQIWEKNKGIVEKPCSSLVSINGLKELDINAGDMILNSFHGAVLHSSHEELTIESKRAKAVVLDRLSLQKQLAEEAEAAGCKIMFGRKWEGEKDDYIIGADGALSAVARQRGVRHDLVYACQARAELRLEPSDSVHLYFGSAPGFFSWAIPISEKEVELGAGCTQGNLVNTVASLAKKLGTTKIWKQQAAVIPMFDPSIKTVFSNIALVGDAAAQVKATTGGGIVFGCKCAKELARAIDNNDLASYEKNWRAKYGRELRLHLAMRKFLNQCDYDELLGRVKESRLANKMRHVDMDSSRSLALAALKSPRLWPYLPKFLFELL